MTAMTALAAVLVACTPDAPNVATDTCYAAETGGDRELLRLHVEGSRVNGNYGWFPAEKDSHWGEFDGTLEAQEVTAELTAHGEGQVAQEPLQILLGDEHATIRSWELVGKTDEQYDVPWTELRSLPQVPCDELRFP